MNEIISAQRLRLAAKGKVNESNMNSVLVALNTYGKKFGLDKPHRLAHFLAQIMHERVRSGLTGKSGGHR